jgi:hypothetical protein
MCGMAKKTPPIDSANQAIEDMLDARLMALEQEADGDVLVFSGPLVLGMEDFIREAVASRFGKRTSRKPKLSMVLETGGGYVEAAQRIVDILRRHYRIVDFIVPNYAMSAGTVLVLSGDAIHMDYYSILGPIDPQVENRDGRLVPALGYIEQYNRLVRKSQDGTLTSAELAFMVEKFDPADLYNYEQAVEHSATLLKEWLVKYKFKNWKQTKTRKVRVTKKLRQERAEQIARTLSKTDEWHSHGRGISMAVLRRKIRLEIDDFGKRPALNGAIRAYYRLLKDYMRRLAQDGVVHTVGQYMPLFF